MEENEKNKPIILVIIGVVCFCYLYVKCVHEPRKLESNHRYTICKIRNIENDAEGGRSADISYYVNGKCCFSSISLDDTKPIQPKINQRYFIKYYPLDPNIFKVDLDYIISDSIQLNEPMDGWKELPIKK